MQGAHQKWKRPQFEPRGLFRPRLDLTVRPRVLLAACTVSLILVALLFGFLQIRSRNRPSEAAGKADLVKSPTNEVSPKVADKPPPPILDRVPFQPAARSDQASDALVASRASAAMLKDIRQLVDLRSKLNQPLEAQVNQMVDYLMGMIQAIRAINPEMFVSLRNNLADGICHDGFNSDRDLLLFSRLALIESSIGSARAIDCALKQHNKEDAVLWSLLDAWNASGRPPVPSLSSIEPSDERTKRRLAPPDEQRAREGRYQRGAAKSRQ